MDDIKVILNGRIIRRSRNLRGMRDYAQVSPVAKIETRKTKEHDRDPRGMLRVTYANGATCHALFNSHAIMIDFIRNRRTWRGAEIEHADGDMGYLTRPGVIAGT